MATLKYKNGSSWVNVALAFYPVGAIYLSYTSVSPADLFGGSWSALGNSDTPRVLRMAQGTGTGGADNTTLSTSNLPSHNHTCSEVTISGGFGLSNNVTINAGGVPIFINHSGCFRTTGSSTQVHATASGSTTNNTGQNSIWFTDTHKHTIGNTGSGSSFSRLPNYQNVYAYQRTA